MSIKVSLLPTDPNRHKAQQLSFTFTIYAILSMQAKKLFVVP